MARSARCCFPRAPRSPERSWADVWKWMTFIQVGVRVGRADAEDLGVIEIPGAALGDEGVHHPVGAARHEAAAVSRRVRVDLPGHAPQDVLVVGEDVGKVVEDGGDVAQGRGHVEVAVQDVHLVRPHGLVYTSQKLRGHCRLLGGDVVEVHGAGT